MARAAVSPSLVTEKESGYSVSARIASFSGLCNLEYRLEDDRSTLQSGFLLFHRIDPYLCSIAPANCSFTNTSRLRL